MERLYTPWRLEYLVSDRAEEGCIFCAALEAPDDRERGVLLRGRHNFVILNRYPYNNGHLMVAPNRHVASLEDSDEAGLSEMMTLARTCERALREVYRPHGINLGMNLGSSAGAGIVDHYHLHVVPRWTGDTNFMTVVGQTRLVPEEPCRTWERLHAALGG